MPPNSSTLCLIGACFRATVHPPPQSAWLYRANYCAPGGSASQRRAMVLYSGSQGKAAEELLPEHQPRQLMGQRERRERQREMAFGDELRRDAEVGADDEGEGMRPLLAALLQPIGESARVEGAAAAVEDDEAVRLRQRAADGRGLA